MPGKIRQVNSIHLTAQHTYGRLERLKSRKRIDQLFREGKRISAPSLLLIYRLHQAGRPSTLQAGVSVKKKQFGRAVDRNRIKRLLREAYRLQKGELKTAVEQGDQSLDLFVLYTGQTLPDYATLYAQTGELIRKVRERYGV